MAGLLTAFPYFHLVSTYSAPASALGRVVGAPLLTTAVGAAVSMCIVVSVVAIGGVDTSISAHHAMITAAPVGPPATSGGPGMLLPASLNFTQPALEIAGGPVKSSPAITDIARPIPIHAEARVKRAPVKKRDQEALCTEQLAPRSHTARYGIHGTHEAAMTAVLARMASNRR